MKRAILVVICDFLILSALSLATGIQNQNGFGGPSPVPAMNTRPSSAVKTEDVFTDQSIELFLKKRKINQLAGDLYNVNKDVEQKKEIITKLTQDKEHLNQIKQKLETDKSKLEVTKNSLESDKEKLLTVKQKLEQEKSKLETVKSKLEQDKSNLESTRKQLEVAKQTLEKSLTNKSKEIDSLKDENLNIRKKNLDLGKDLLDKEGKLADLNRNKAILEENSKKLAQDLTVKSKKLENLLSSSDRLKDANLKLYNLLKKKKSDVDKLASMSKNLVDEKQKLLKSLEETEKQLAQLKTQHQDLAQEKTVLEKENELKNMHIKSLKENNKIVVEGYVNLREIIKDKDGNIETLKDHLDEVKSEKEDLKDEITHKKTEISELRKKLQGTGYIWEKYHIYAREVNIHMRERSPFIDNIYKNKYYLPLVQIGDVIMLAAEFNSIGLGWDKIYGGQVSQLAIKVYTDKEKTKYVELSQPIISLNTMQKVCFMQIPYSKDLKAFKPIGISKLRKRGLDGIYLFKLDGRSREIKTSFIQDGQDYLLVQADDMKNSKINAEEGDFLFTKEGEYVGVLISDNKCFIQPLTFNISDYTQIPISKPANAKLYDVFSHTVKTIVDRLEK